MSLYCTKLFIKCLSQLFVTLDAKLALSWTSVASQQQSFVTDILVIVNIHCSTV